MAENSPQKEIHKSIQHPLHRQSYPPSEGPGEAGLGEALPGIQYISYIPCKLLPPDITLRAISGTPVAIYSIATTVALSGAATCENTASPENNAQLEKAVLTFYTTDDTIPIDEPLAFVATTVQGQSYIIGRYEQPYPSVKRTRTTGTPDGDRSVLKYEVSFTSLRALVPCSI